MVENFNKKFENYLDKTTTSLGMGFIWNNFRLYLHIFFFFKELSYGNQLRHLELMLEEFTVIPADIFKKKNVESFYQNNKNLINEVLEFLNILQYTSACISNEKLDFHVLNELYPSFCDILKPHKTSMNGNCLWNMLSISLCGNESLTRLLRLLTVLCMLILKNQFVTLLSDHYKSTNTLNADSLAEINFQENVRTALENEEWGNMYHLISMSTILGKNIYVYNSFQRNRKFMLSKNIKQKDLNEYFIKRDDLIGHHLKYEGLKNNFFPKTHRNLLYGYFDVVREHYTALIPSKTLEIQLFVPKNSLF